MLLLPGSLEHMGDWDGLGMTTRGLRVGGDVGWGGAGGRGRGLSLLHLLFLAQTYLRQSKRCVCCQHCSLDVFVNNANIYIFFHLFFFLAMLRSLWDLSSLSRDQTWVPCSGNTVS